MSWVGKKGTRNKQTNKKNHRWENGRVKKSSRYPTFGVWRGKGGVGSNYPTALKTLVRAGSPRTPKENSRWTWWPNMGPSFELGFLVTAIDDVWLFVINTFVLQSVDRVTLLPFLLTQAPAIPQESVLKLLKSVQSHLIGQPPYIIPQSLYRLPSVTSLGSPYWKVMID